MQEIISGPQIVSVHTYTGKQLYQYTGSQLVDLTWTRESCETSRAELHVASTIFNTHLPKLTAWLHWISVWDKGGKSLLWRGPVVGWDGDRRDMAISARDLSAYFGRTRSPLTKSWEVEAPEDIADELIAGMVELHNLNNRPVVRRDPFGDKFDYTVTADEAMLDTVIDDLVRLGLHWTVVAGELLLGPLPRTIVAALAERDFVGGSPRIKHDGTVTFNDVLLRSGDSETYAKVPMGGLALQTIVTADDVEGPSNTDRATQQYARHVSKIRNTLMLPDQTVLHPNAPITIDRLIPSARFTVDALDELFTMQLTGVDVSFTPQSSSVSVRATDVEDDLPELIELQQKATGQS